MRNKKFRSKRVNHSRNINGFTPDEKTRKNEEFTTLPVQEEPQAKEKKKEKGEIEVSEEEIAGAVDETTSPLPATQKPSEIHIPQFNPYGTDHTDLILLFFILVILITQEEVDSFLVFLLLLILLDII
ncbi:MAG: hypothetical protein PWQ96_1498 [Clostridia bacterium]|jgi:hypothetical protein|nr:hypothetical protein [Clostridiales bacterium]MDK2985856.1 hypothetical protein [Clostridia bacterium]